MTNPTITNEQLEAWAGLGPWEWQKLAEFSSPKHSLGPGVLLTDERDGTPWGDTLDQTNAALIAAAPALAAALLAERKAREVEVANLKGLAWIAYHEFNAINARSGGPLDQYGMVTVTHEYWQAITDLLAKAAGETTPWPTDNAKAIFEQIKREREKDQPHE